MENETYNQEEVQVEQKSQLHQVTPLSKYLALALFVILPFLGGWIGYTYAPEKVVEVEKVIVKEVVAETENIAVTSSEAIVSAKAQETEPYMFEDEKVLFTFDLSSDLTIFHPENGHRQFFVAKKTSPKEYMIGMKVQADLDEQGNKQCHLGFCFLETQKLIETTERNWNYLGASSYSDAGQAAEYPYVYSSSEAGFTIYLHSDVDLHSKQDILTDLFNSIDLEVK